MASWAQRRAQLQCVWVVLQAGEWRYPLLLVSSPSTRFLHHPPSTIPHPPLPLCPLCPLPAGKFSILDVPFRETQTRHLGHNVGLFLGARTWPRLVHGINPSPSFPGFPERILAESIVSFVALYGVVLSCSIHSLRIRWRQHVEIDRLDSYWCGGSLLCAALLSSALPGPESLLWLGGRLTEPDWRLSDGILTRGSEPVLTPIVAQARTAEEPQGLARRTVRNCMGEVHRCKWCDRRCRWGRRSYHR